MDVSRALSRLLRRQGLALVACALLFLIAMPGHAVGNDGAMSPRADFRPLSRAEDKALYQMRRPALPRSSRQSMPLSKRLPDITADRAGVRKAVPVTRGQELGLRFRPDDRAAVQGTYLEPLPGQSVSDDVQSQFRPMEQRQKPSYEQLEAQRRSENQARNASPFGYTPLQPPPLPPFGMPLRPW